MFQGIMIASLSTTARRWAAFGIIAAVIAMAGCGGQDPAPSGPAKGIAPPATDGRSAEGKTGDPAEPEGWAALEAAIQENPGAPDVGNRIVQLEQLILNHIRRHGPGRRYLIREIVPRDTDDSAACCLVANSGGGAMAMTDLPGDKIPLAMPFLTSRAVYGEGSCWIPNIFEPGAAGIVPTNNVPGGDGAIHRYEGAIALGAGVDFIIVGDKSRTNRLTFSLIKGVGYVYLRGKGGVLNSKGAAVKLGGGLSAPPDGF
jgi:hypothetical protein